MGYKYLNFVDLLTTPKINNPRKFLALRYQHCINMILYDINKRTAKHLQVLETIDRVEKKLKVDMLYRLSRDNTMYGFESPGFVDTAVCEVLTSQKLYLNPRQNRKSYNSVHTSLIR